MRAETRQPVRQLVQTEPCGSMRNDKSWAQCIRSPPEIVNYYTADRHGTTEIVNFRVTDDFIYLLRPNASPEAVPRATSSSIDVCGSVFLFYWRLCPRRSLLWEFVLPFSCNRVLR